SVRRLAGTCATRVPRRIVPVPAMGQNHPKTVVVIVVVGMVPVPRPAAFGAGNRDTPSRQALHVFAPHPPAPPPPPRHTGAPPGPLSPAWERGRSVALGFAARGGGAREGLAPAAQQASDLVDQARDMLVLAQRHELERLALAQQDAQLMQGLVGGLERGALVA